MPFTNAWDETKPAGTRDLNLGDDDIREFKQQVRERLALDHHFPSSDDGDTGYHDLLTLIAQGSDPSAIASKLRLYSKTTAGFAELFSVHESNVVNQLTLNGKILIEALTVGSIAQGDIFYHDGTKVTRLGAGTTGQFLKTLGAGANPLWANLSGSYINGLFKNLKIVNSGNHVVVLTADEALIDDGAGSVLRLTSINEQADIEAVAGAGGLDAGPGAEAVNTIYYIWLIGKTDGTKKLMLSASSSAPTMPSGYTYKALVSAVGNNNASNFIGFTQRGRMYVFTTWGVMASGNVGTGTWIGIDLTPANMSTNPGFVPSALSAHAFGSFSGGSGANGAMTNDNSITADVTTRNQANKLIDGGNLSRWQFDLLTADTLYWQSAAGDAAVYLQGFFIDKLV